MKGNDENSYRSILKGTSFFGGVQMLQVLITLVRGKFVAILLGPEGMGISSLFTTSSNTLQRFSSLGLNLAIVKEVAAESERPDSLRTIISVARKLIAATALAGALICVLFSSLLSRITFGTPDMAWQFVMLGAVVGLSVAYNGYLSIMQGLHEVKRISLASLVGSISGLAIGVPLYYLFGTKGIVPAMLAFALTMYIFYAISLKRSTGSVHTPFSWGQHKPLVKKLVVLGLILMTNDLLASLVQYLINIYIQHTGSTYDVGLYQSANSITNQYSGMVFAAMAMDFFPRMSKVASDNEKMREVVNRQNEIVSLIITPAMTLLILTSPILIRLLLSSDFLPVTPLMRWMGLGITIRALMIPMGYISFAKGNKKLFFWLEGIFCNVLTLTLALIFLHFFGLIGLGYALVADNAICLITYYIINHRLYNYSFSKRAISDMAIALIFTVATFAASLIHSAAISLSLMSALVILTITWTGITLRKKLKAGKKG